MHKYEARLSFACNQLTELQITKAPLPNWLSDTFAQLEPQNPLRKLVAPLSQNSDENSTFTNDSRSSDRDDAMLSTNIPEQAIFAFSHPQEQDDPHLCMSADAHTDLPEEQHFRNYWTQPNLTIVQPTNSAAARAEIFDSAPSDDSNLGHQRPDPNAQLLPFSTPGPGSNVSLASSHHEPRPTVEYTILSDSCNNNENEHWPLFSTPGPLARSSSQRLTSHAPLNQFPPLLVSAEMTPEPIFSYGLDLLPSSEDYLSDLPNPDLPHADIELPPATKPSSRIKNPFSTPGPRFYAAVRPGIYFDSPTEDPSDSDPLELPQGFQVDELDFRWEPFMRHERRKRDEDVQIRGEDDSMDSSISNEMGFEVHKDSPELQSCDIPTPSVELAENALSPISNQRVEQMRSATPEPKAQPVFAPAPGIFISPLRGVPGSPEPHVQSSKPNSQVNITDTLRPSNQ